MPPTPTAKKNLHSFCSQARFSGGVFFFFYRLILCSEGKRRIKVKPWRSLRHGLLKSVCPRILRIERRERKVKRRVVFAYNHGSTTNEGRSTSSVEEPLAEGATRCGIAMIREEELCQPLRSKQKELYQLLRARSAGDFRITCPVKTMTRPLTWCSAGNITCPLTCPSPALHLPFYMPIQNISCPHKHLWRCL